jgi:hypothetical protein
MARKVKNLQTLAVVEKSKEEILRQEGREEVLEWLRKYEIVSYSKPEDVYFIYDRKSEVMLVLPWRQGDKGSVG